MTIFHMHWNAVWALKAKLTFLFTQTEKISTRGYHFFEDSSGLASHYTCQWQSVHISITEFLWTVKSKIQRTTLVVSWRFFSEWQYHKLRVNNTGSEQAVHRLLNYLIIICKTLCQLFFGWWNSNGPEEKNDFTFCFRKVNFSLGPLSDQ